MGFTELTQLSRRDTLRSKAFPETQITGKEHGAWGPLRPLPYALCAMLVILRAPGLPVAGRPFDSTQGILGARYRFFTKPAGELEYDGAR